VPATTRTGEVTVALLAGVQMVTEGSTVLCGQGAAEAVETMAAEMRAGKKRLGFHA